MVDAKLDVRVLVEVELAVSSSDVDICPDCPGRDPSVHVHCRCFFRRPATGVSGQTSLSDSDDESLLSPTCGELVLDLGRWGSRRRRCGCDRADRLGLITVSESDPSVGCSNDRVDSMESDDEFRLEACSKSPSSDEMDIEDAVSESSDATRSECANVYFVLTISSTRGVRNDTLFSAGNLGRNDILRMFARGCRGLLASTEFST